MDANESTQEQLDAFILRAGFTYGWRNLESWARRMAERAVEEHDGLVKALKDLSQTDGSPGNVANTEVLAARVRAFANAALAAAGVGKCG